MTKIECIYGPPLSGKTTQIISLIKRLNKEQPDKIARVYVGDGSLANYLESGLVDAGIIKVLDYSGRAMPFTVTEMIAEGYWAEDPFDPTSKLVQLTPEEFNTTAIWVYEGLSVQGAYLLSNVEGGLAWRAARGEKIGQDSPISVRDKDGRVFGGNPMSHYNVAQKHLSGCITRTKRLPGMIIWTAHEKSAEDKLQGETIVGPELAGGALTPVISREFNNTLHTTKAVIQTTKDVDKTTGQRVTEEKVEFRLYTQDHYDPDGKFSTKYRAGVRTMRPDLIKPYYVSPINQIGKGIIDFYEDLARAKKAYQEM